MSLNDVSVVLWRQRELLEMLLFKLEEEQLLIANGKTRWLPHATREVEIVVGQVQELESLRAIEVDTAAAELGLPPNPSLAQLADAAPGHWRDILHAHREAFLAVTHEIQTVAKTNKTILTVSQRAAAETLMSLDDSFHAYDLTGQRTTSTSGAGRARLVDEAL